jgi:hypothetical protein
VGHPPSVFYPKRLERFEHFERFERRKAITSEKENIMEDKNASWSSNMWAVFFILLAIIAVAGVLMLPAISPTAKLFLLGSGLIAAGIWGRRRLRQG